MASRPRPPASSSGRSIGSWSTPDPRDAAAASDPGAAFDLDRFVRAQAGVHEQALTEVRRGRKASHWMWFVYPQLRGLGRSEVSRFYGLASLDEARAYLAHPVLGPRLRAAAEAALAAPSGLSAEDVFGPVDAMKLRSSMTLFHRAVPEDRLFAAVLERHAAGIEDPATLELLGERPSP